MSKKILVFDKDTDRLNVCPYSYSVCELPASEVCAWRGQLNQIRDTTDWHKLVGHALGCKYRGLVLTRSQYDHRRIGVVV